MHIIISIFVAIGAILFWLSRAANNARDVADAAQELSNLPRKLRYRKQAGKQGLDLIEEPVEAAAILMISIARMDGLRRVSDKQAEAISGQLETQMLLPADDAKDMVIQLRSLTQYLKQADSTLFPMIKLLQTKVTKSEAKDLSSMMLDVAATDDPVNEEQSNFIRRFEERMGIGAG